MFRPAIEKNGFQGAPTAVAHSTGYAISDTADPVRGDVYTEALSYNSASTSVTALGGMSIRRHHLRASSGAGLTSRWRWMIDHEFDSSGPGSVTFTLWNHIGPDFQGFFSGRPTYWGSYVYGVPTPPGADLGSASRTYRGLAGMSYLFPDYTLNRFVYGPVEAIFNPTSQTVTITVTTSQLSTLVDNGNGISNSTGPVDPTFMPQIFRDRFQCVATVDPATRTFQCSLTLPLGEIRGRFYGATGDEIGAVLHRWEFSGSNTNWGPIGGFAAKAVP